TSASVLERYGRDMAGFIGGRDAAGNTQFPKTKLPVAPGVEAAPMTDVRLADETGTVVSITADRLNYCPDPPFHFGLVQFPGGARVLMEVTDIAGKAPAVGDPLRMRFRMKSADRRRGFRTYFWKAAPTARPALEG
ncbi:MAG: OB-fold domain-containing protein, partial [Zavarzinia sp.]|nr:OB-fold domain-containing protein [Zavarzinia sp.]